MMFYLAKTVTACPNQTDKLQSLLSIPDFEKAVFLIKHFETLHHSENWPYIVCGHKVQPGQPYKSGYTLSERQADALLCQDLRKFCSLYRKMGRDSLLLGALVYKCGPTKVNKSSVLRKLQAGDWDIRSRYLFFCHCRGKKNKRLLLRRLLEYELLYIKHINNHFILWLQ